LNIPARLGLRYKAFQDSVIYTVADTVINPVAFK